MNELVRAFLRPTPDGAVQGEAEQFKRALIQVGESCPVNADHSTIITTNLVYDEWHNFLGNKSMVDALLSRVRHYCHTMTINGPSLRDPQG